MVAHDAPMIFAKACEIFILDLTIRAWEQANANGRKMLHREDVAQVVNSNEYFEFLNDLVLPDTNSDNPINTTITSTLRPVSISSSSSSVPSSSSSSSSSSTTAPVVEVKGDGTFGRPLQDPLQAGNVVAGAELGKHDLDIKQHEENTLKKQALAEAEANASPSSLSGNKRARSNSNPETNLENPTPSQAPRLDQTLLSHSPSSAALLIPSSSSPQHMSLDSPIPEQGVVDLTSSSNSSSKSS